MDVLSGESGRDRALPVFLSARLATGAELGM